MSSSSKQAFDTEIKALYQLTRDYIKHKGTNSGVSELSQILFDYLKQLSLPNKNNCADLFNAFYSLHTSDLGTLIFPDLASITSKSTTDQNEAILDPRVDYFMLFQMLEDSRKIIPKGCTRYWETHQRHQYNYAFRRRFYLKHDLLTLKSAQHKDASKVILCLAIVQEQYLALPSNIQSIQSDPDFQKTLLLSPAELLETIYKDITKPVYQEAIMASAIVTLTINNTYSEALDTVPSRFLANYNKALDTLSFLYEQRSVIEQLKTQLLPAGDIAPKTHQLQLLTKKIELLEKEIALLEDDDQYETAKQLSAQLKNNWLDFQTTYNQLVFETISPQEVTGTRFESSYLLVNSFYNRSSNTLEFINQNIQHNYDALDSVVVYQKQRYLTWKSLETTYMIGAPIPQNKTDVEHLIQLLKIAKTHLETQPSLHTICSLKAKDLNIELQQLEQYLDAITQLLTQTKRWKETLTTFEGLDGYSLEPNTFTVDKIKKFRTKKVTLASSGNNDGNNLTASNDIDQGTAKDASFLASIASMATTPNFFYGNQNSVIQIVHPEKRKGRRDKDIYLPNPKKIQYFSVKMHLPIESDNMDQKTGRTPVNVLVYPTKELIGKNESEFAKKADSGELWVIILERAFAELKGGYDKLEGGFSEEAFALLMNKAPEDFNRINFKDKEILKKLKETYKDETLSKVDVITQKLTDSLTSKITLSTPSEAELLALGATKSSSIAPEGAHKVFIYDNDNSVSTDTPDLILYANHTYSIQSSSNGLFTIRNPHGGSSSNPNYKKETLFTLTGEQIVQYFSAAVILQ